MTQELITKLINQQQTLESDRSNLNNDFDDIARYFRPTRSGIIDDKRNSISDRYELRDIRTSLPIVSLETLSAILNGTLTNSSVKWFVLELPDKLKGAESQELQEFIDDISDNLWIKAYDPRARLREALSEAYKDIIAFGTGAMFINKGKTSLFNFITIPIADYLIAENDEGQTDYFIWKTKKTTRQILQQWGDNPNATIPDEIKKAEAFKKFDISLHIFPREKRDLNKIDLKNKKIAGYWVDTTNKQIIEEIGWDSMPVAIGRTEKYAGDIYGTGRGMMALSEVRELNAHRKELTDILIKASKPPLIVNAVFKNSINMRTGGINVYEPNALLSNRPAVEPLITTGSTPEIKFLFENSLNTIDRIFFLDKLKVIEDPRATATQIIRQQAESFRMMSPFTAGIEFMLDAILQRCLDILFDQSYIIRREKQGVSYSLKPNSILKEEVPEELQEAGGTLNINFTNPITQSQRLSENDIIDAWVGGTLQLAEADPSIIDNINFDEVSRQKADILDIEPSLMRSKAEVQNIRASRQQAIEEQQQNEQEQQLVQSASQAKQSGLI